MHVILSCDIPFTVSRKEYTKLIKELEFSFRFTGRQPCRVMWYYIQILQNRYTLWQKNCWINRENPCSRCCTARYTRWMNEESKTCAQLDELTIKVFYITRKVFQVMPNNPVIHNMINWNRLFKLKSKLHVQALNGFPLSIHRGKAHSISLSWYVSTFFSQSAGKSYQYSISDMWCHT